MKLPGPDHPITITPATSSWRARFNGRVIADSASALALKEASYPLVIYFPRADVAMDALSRTERSTHCPYKGDAAYYTMAVDGEVAPNVIWTYEVPFPAMAEISGYLAFYADRVDVYEVDDGVR